MSTKPSTSTNDSWFKTVAGPMKHVAVSCDSADCPTWRITNPAMHVLAHMMERVPVAVVASVSFSRLVQMCFAFNDEVEYGRSPDGNLRMESVIMSAIAHDRNTGPFVYSRLFGLPPAIWDSRIKTVDGYEQYITPVECYRVGICRAQKRDLTANLEQLFAIGVYVWYIHGMPIRLLATNLHLEEQAICDMIALALSTLIENSARFLVYYYNIDPAIAPMLKLSTIEARMESYKRNTIVNAYLLSKRPARMERLTMEHKEKKPYLSIQERAAAEDRMNRYAKIYLSQIRWQIGQRWNIKPSEVFPCDGAHYFALTFEEAHER